MPLAERVLALLLVALACGCVLALVGRPAPGRRAVAAAVLLGIGSLWWLFSSRAYEGPTVLALSATRGLTAVDLAVPPDLCLAAGVLVRAEAARRSRNRAGPAGRRPGTRPGPPPPPAPG